VKDFLKTIFSAMKIWVKGSIKEVSYKAETALETKMELENPVGIGSFSMNRKNNTEIGNFSHAEGFDTTASGDCSHAEGFNTTASGDCSHAEGYCTTASGDYSHVEGYCTTASGDYSHVEGYCTTASGDYSHAEGSQTTALGSYSHAEGYYTQSTNASQHVQGEYNIVDPEYNGSNQSSRGKYVHIVGNGTTYDNRSNAHTLDWDGNAWFAGDVYVSSTSGVNKDEGSKKLITLDDITDLAGKVLFDNVITFKYNEHERYYDFDTNLDLETHHRYKVIWNGTEVEVTSWFNDTDVAPCLEVEDEEYGGVYILPSYVQLSEYRGQVPSVSRELTIIDLEENVQKIKEELLPNDLVFKEKKLKLRNILPS
jgi:hypothetical protein